MRRRHGGGQDQDSPRVNFDMVVQSNRASRHRTAQQAADSFWGLPPATATSYATAAVSTAGGRGCAI